MEFKSFNEIARLSSQVTVTEKVHGTNAQILIESYGTTESAPSGWIVKAGSRTRWITPEDDNYGFAAWVLDNREALIKALGPGRHFGEWYGSGINSGYSMTKGEKRFALFKRSFADKELPPGVGVVPVLYRGPWTSTCVESCMDILRKGSVIAPGFTKPEGVVVRFERNGAMFKQVFEAEESAWKGSPKEKKDRVEVDETAVNALLQPIRLEKLISRDERYLREYPSSLPQIVKDYMADMEKEQQFEGVDEVVSKAARNRAFKWVKEVMLQNGYTT